MSAIDTQAQVVAVPLVEKPAPLYPFLSRPPPQKKRPTQPLPSPPPQAPASPTRPLIGRRRSATIAAISAWVSDVHPGSPAPCSPKRSPSAFTTRRPSFSRTSSRRPSHGSGRVPSISFINFHDTPTTASRLVITPSIKDFEPDLTAMGYTSVFVRFPDTPRSPPGIACPTSKSHTKAAPASPVRPRLKHFHSLSALRTGKRTRSKAPPSPVVASRTPGETKHAKALQEAAIIRNKKSKYAKLRPAPLANELALAQLMDGGKLDDHVKRYAHVQAKAAGAAKVDGQLVGVGDVWRDGEGGIWMDQDEEWEFAHLLGGDDTGEVQWVRFGMDPSNPEDDVERRESLSTQDSDLSARYAMNVDTDPHDDLANFGSAALSPALCKPGMSVLAIPARSRRTAKHLRKPEFLLDVFPVPLSPTLGTAFFPPRSPQYAAFHIVARAKGKTRKHRPAPLTLVPPSPAKKLPMNPSDPEEIRKEFLQDSFAPPPRKDLPRLPTISAIPVQRTIPTPTTKSMSKPSIANMRGIFKTFAKKNSRN